MEKKSTGHTVYQQIRRVSVLGILVAMVLATGAGLSLNLLQERRIRDDTLTTAVQAVSHTLTITNADDVELVMEYVDRTVHGISGIDLFAVYDTDGTPVYFCDITESGDDASTLETLDSALRRFKRSCAKSGVLSEVRKREHYESPSVKRRKKSEAARAKKRSYR